VQFVPTLHKLSNGIPVIIDPMDIATACMSVSFGTGSRDEALHEFGIAHFLEHILNNGTARLPSARAIADYLENLGGTRNASTTSRGVRVYGRILSENIGELASVFADMIGHSLFDEKKIETEKKIITDELNRRLDDPDTQMYDFAVERLFAGSGMAHEIVGTVQNINSFSRDQLIAYAKSHLSAANCIIGISGKMEDCDKLLADLERLYGWAPRTPFAPNDALPITHGAWHNRKPGQKNVKLSIAFTDKTPRDLSGQYQNMCVGKYDMMLRRNLNETVRQKHGLVYSIGLDTLGNENAGVSIIDTETAPENLEKCVAQIARVCRDSLTNGITESELQRYKNYGKLGDANFLENAASRRDRLIGFYRKHGVLYDFDAAVKMADSVAAGDIKKFSMNYFDGDFSIITQGPEFDADLRKAWIDNFQ
jgi:predicted Zn-dependent peptidase